MSSWLWWEWAVFCLMLLVAYVLGWICGWGQGEAKALDKLRTSMLKVCDGLKEGAKRIDETMTIFHRVAEVMGAPPPSVVVKPEDKNREAMDLAPGSIHYVEEGEDPPS